MIVCVIIFAMGMKEILTKLEDGVARVLCGPKVEGTVLLVKRDKNLGRFWHLLIETDEKERRHIIMSDDSLCITNRGLEVVDMPFKRRDRFVTNIRGSGVTSLPWSKLERDPFGNIAFLDQDSKKKI